MMSDIFNPQNKDTDVLIEKILTPLFGYEKGNYEDLFWVEPMSIFLQALCILMGVLFIFNTVKDITNTANTGQSIGGKGSLTWNIIRNVAGIALLIPVKGVAAIQIAFIWIVAQGLLLANSIYENMDFFKSSTSNFSFVSNVQGELYKSYKNAVLSNVCLLSAQKYQQQTNNFDFGLSVTQSKSNDGFVYNYSFGNKHPKEQQHRDICGKLSVFFPLQKDDQKLLNTTSKLAELSSFKIIDVEKVSNQFQKIHLNNMHNLITVKAKEAAQELLKYGNTDAFVAKFTEKTVKDLAEYEDKIKQEFANVKVVNDDVKQYMTKHGIAGAGAWIWAISNTQSNLTNIVNDVPKVTLSLNTSSNYGESCTWYKKAFSDDRKKCSNFEALQNISGQIIANIDSAGSVFKNVENNISNKFVKAENGLYEVASAEVDEINDSVIDKVLKFFEGLKNVNQTLTVDRFETQNPLVAAQGMGQLILMILQSAIIGLGTISIFNSAATTIAIAIFPFLITLFVTGIMITFYFAFLPFIIWMGNLVGWIVLIVQGIIGAPIWLVSFLRNDTDDFVGKTGQGYLLVLEAFLRPTLMILALFFAFHLLSPVVGILNYFFWFVGNSIYSNTNSFLVVSYYIFMIIIYCVMTHKVLFIIFGLMEQIPDKILQWIGSNVNSVLGNLGKQFDNMTLQGTEKANAQVGAGVTSTSQLINKGIEQRRANKEKERLAQEKEGLKSDLNVANSNTNANKDIKDLFK